jgi:hypothetical protein
VCVGGGMGVLGLHLTWSCDKHKEVVRRVQVTRRRETIV